jgi:membrane protein
MPSRPRANLPDARPTEPAQDSGAVVSSDAAAPRRGVPVDPLTDPVTILAPTPGVVAVVRPEPFDPLGVVRDVLRRIWDHAGEDNLFFLAGAVAFNLLAALVPFLLLLVAGIAYVLDLTPVDSAREVTTLIEGLLPPQSTVASEMLQRVVADVIRTRGAVTLYSAIIFAWLSTRLFGTLRSVLAEVFDIEQERGIVWGKLFDLGVTIIGSVLIVAYVALSVYLSLATSRGVRVLAQWGVRGDVMGELTYIGGRLVAFAVLAAAFFGLYKWLPNRAIRWQTALLAGGVSAALFEIARGLFTRLLSTLSPNSLYTGTIAAVAIVVLWVYWAAILFIIGGEVAHVTELRRLRRLRRVTLA